MIGGKISSGRTLLFCLFFHFHFDDIKCDEVSGVRHELLLHGLPSEGTVNREISEAIKENRNQDIMVLVFTT
jgi:hypothetical protein